MLEIKLVQNWDDFKELIFRLANAGLYVMWTASQYNDGRKGLYLMDFGAMHENKGLKDRLMEMGFEHKKTSMRKNGALMHFVSMKLHD